MLKADGKSRGKIGVPPQSAKGYVASYSELKEELTIASYQNAGDEKMYLNSKWELQKILLPVTSSTPTTTEN